MPEPSRVHLDTRPYAQMCRPEYTGASELEEGEGWPPFRVGQILSLLDMLQFSAPAWVKLFSDMQALADSVQTDLTVEERAEKVSPDVRDVLLQRVVTTCERMDLPVSLALAKRIMAGVADQKVTWDQFRSMVADLWSRANDETASRLFFYVPSEQAKYFQQRDAFGEQVAVAFPSSTIDIEEAGNCLATTRNTACVLHLMRALESAVHSLATSLGIAYEFRGWDAVIKKMRAELEKSYPLMDPAMKGKKDFYTGALDRLLAVKDSLRNPSMHGRTHYDYERAEDVYHNTRQFMQHIALRLSEAEEG